MREGFEAQVAMFPNMVNDQVAWLIDEYRDCALGWKLSGAGGGGYFILVSEKDIPDAVRIQAHRGTIDKLMPYTLRNVMFRIFSQKGDSHG